MRSVVAGPVAIVLTLSILSAGGLAGQATSPDRQLTAGHVAPSSVRTAAGRPGAGYWQQRADYQITATLDPATSRLTGRETISYHNNSPDSLFYIWLHVEQNICAPQSLTNQLHQPPLVFQDATFDFSCQGFSGGGTMESLTVNGDSATRTAYGTIMRVDLARPLAPGAVAELAIAWHFSVPPYGAGRMGHDGTLYELGQWYPRVAVYDDVKGWNHEPYIGAGEFYLEYGKFDVKITLPSSYVVAATGRLLNPEETLTATERARLARAATSDTTVAIITAAEAGKPSARPTSTGTLTWRFTADSVRDFAFAAAPNFRWDASGYDGILIHTYYRPSATLWTEANRIARHAVKYFSEQWLKYPYPHASSIEGPIEGMEYPMMTFDPTGPDRLNFAWTVAHELGHQWTPMIVGSNERLYPWMDEGFNTFIDLGNAAAYFKGTPYGDSIEVHPLHLYEQHAVAGQEQPLITNPIESHDLFWTGYQKPALMMQTLRYHVLGKERFDDAFRAYLKAWAFKHPTPDDFFRLMRDRSGRDLDWYWQDWIYTTSRPDQAVTAISNADSGATVTLENKGTMQLPVFLKLTYADGSSASVTLPVEMWNLGPTYVYRVSGKKRVVKAEIDPEGVLPDVERGNNEQGPER